MASTTPTAEKSVNNGNAFSLAPKLTQAQCERERKGRKIQTLKTDVIRLGFHAHEVDEVFAGIISVNVSNFISLTTLRYCSFHTRLPQMPAQL